MALACMCFFCWGVLGVVCSMCAAILGASWFASLVVAMLGGWGCLTGAGWGAVLAAVPGRLARPPTPSSSFCTVHGDYATPNCCISVSKTRTPVEQSSNTGSAASAGMTLSFVLSVLAIGMAVTACCSGAFAFGALLSESSFVTSGKIKDSCRCLHCCAGSCMLCGRLASGVRGCLGCGGL